MALISVDQLRQKFWLGPMTLLDGADGRTSAFKAGDPGSSSGPGRIFALELTAHILSQAEIEMFI